MRIVQAVTLAPVTIVVMDRGNLDYPLYSRWTATECGVGPGSESI